MEASNAYVVSMGTEKRRFYDLHVDCEPNASMSAVTETDSPPLAISSKNKNVSMEYCYNTQKTRTLGSIM